MALRLEDITLTSWMDPVFAYFAKEAGIGTEEYSSIAGSQGIGASIEVLMDLFTQPLLSKVAQGIAGLASVCYGIWGKPGTRLQKEVIVLGQQMLTRLVDPKPSDIIALRKNIDQVVAAVKAGNMAALTAALLRSPAELSLMLKALGAPVNLDVVGLGRPEIPAIPPGPIPAPRLAGFPFPSPVAVGATFAPPQYTLDTVPGAPTEIALLPKYTLGL